MRVILPMIDGTVDLRIAEEILNTIFPRLNLNLKTVVYNEELDMVVQGNRRKLNIEKLTGKPDIFANVKVEDESSPEFLMPQYQSQTQGTPIFHDTNVATSVYPMTQQVRKIMGISIYAKDKTAIMKMKSSIIFTQSMIFNGSIEKVDVDYSIPRFLMLLLSNIKGNYNLYAEKNNLQQVSFLEYLDKHTTGDMFYEFGENKKLRSVKYRHTIFNLQLIISISELNSKLAYDLETGYYTISFKVSFFPRTVNGLHITYPLIAYNKPLNKIFFEVNNLDNDYDSRQYLTNPINDDILNISLSNRIPIFSILLYFDDSNILINLMDKINGFEFSKELIAYIMAVLANGGSLSDLFLKFYLYANNELTKAEIGIDSDLNLYLLNPEEINGLFIYRLVIALPFSLDDFNLTEIDGIMVYLLKLLATGKYDFNLELLMRLLKELGLLDRLLALILKDGNYINKTVIYIDTSMYNHKDQMPWVADIQNSTINSYTKGS